MGEFARQVRRGLIPGPQRSKFDRARWAHQASLEDQDDEDLSLAKAGLIFDELLNVTRAKKAVASIGLSPQLLARSAIALVNYNYYHINQHSGLQATADGIFHTSDIHKRYFRTAAGADFKPDELFSGLGDGLRYLLTDIVPATGKNNAAVTNDSMTEDNIGKVAAELHVAVEYHVLVDCWHDCAANGYSLQERDGVLELAPRSPNAEIARIASTYRRSALALESYFGFLRWWKYKLSGAQREQLCTIRLVNDLTISNDKVEHISIGRTFRIVQSHASSVAALLEIELGSYGSMLDTPLPDLDGLTLKQLLHGWQFLQSLASKLYAFSASRIREDQSFFSFAPLIRGRILVAALSDALNVARSHGARLLKALTFTGKRAQELWAQPLVQSNDDFLLVIPCIHAVHLLRVLEAWMRQGGFRFDQRGPEFESYCREKLLRFQKECPIRDSVRISERPVRFMTTAGVEEEIDLVIVVHDTILLVEAKCILWPDEAAQFANYRSTVEEAAGQIQRKRAAVNDNYSAFSAALAKVVDDIPRDARILECVLTNSAVYAGFSFCNLPVIDLDILKIFFAGKHVSWQVWHGNVISEESVIELYQTAPEAALNLEGFLNDPPQLRRIKSNIEPRTVALELRNANYESLLISTFEINIDSAREINGNKQSLLAAGSGAEAG